MSENAHPITCPEQCQRAFTEIHRKLDRLDEAIRGNGKPGIALRLDRLEQEARGHARLIWLIVGAAMTAFGSAMVAWITS